VLYRVIKGKREQLAGGNVEVSANAWRSLGLKAERDRFIVTLDGKALFSPQDGTFRMPARWCCGPRPTV